VIIDLLMSGIVKKIPAPGFCSSGSLWNDIPPAVQSMILHGISPASLRGLITFLFMGPSR